MEKSSNNQPKKSTQAQNDRQFAKKLKKDDATPLASAEKPLKITNPKGFDDTISKIVRAK